MDFAIARATINIIIVDRRHRFHAVHHLFSSGDNFT